jgi:hypothetical protein
MMSPHIARYRLKRLMKNDCLFSSRCPFAIPAWLLSWVLLTGSWAGAQNFVRNPDFEQPLRPDNWSIVYVGASSESDFYMHGRTTLAHRDKVFGTWDGNYFGLHFRPYTDSPMEAYATQTVSNLTAGTTYTVTAWMTQFQGDIVDASQVYMQAIGGSTASTPYILGFTHLDQTDTNGWRGHSVNVTANSRGQIEVRLRYKKPGYTSNQKWLSAIDAFYDHVSVMPLVPTLLPAPQILALTVTNQTATLKWTTVMNNTYNIEVSPDFASWSKFKTNLVATGTNLTCNGALTADPVIPQFFRVVSYDYVP